MFEFRILFIYVMVTISILYCTEVLNEHKVRNLINFSDKPQYSHIPINGKFDHLVKIFSYKGVNITKSDYWLALMYVYVQGG